MITPVWTIAFLAILLIYTGYQLVWYVRYSTEIELRLQDCIEFFEYNQQQERVNEFIFALNKNLIFETNQLGWATVNLDNIVIECNAAFSKMAGYSHPKLLGLTWMEFTHEDDITPDAHFVDELIENKKDYYKFAKRYKGGDLIPFVHVLLTVVLIRSYTIIGNKRIVKPKNFLAIIQPITEQEFHEHRKGMKG